jgi:plasmid stabilization system protein ParE
VTPVAVRFHPAAIEEAEAAAEWYVRRSPRAAELFLEEVENAVERLSHNPTQFPEYIGSIRLFFA